MKRRIIFLAVAAIAIVMMIGASASNVRSGGDDDVYNQIAIVKGNVQILNHPELGKTPASGQYLVFQRDG